MTNTLQYWGRILAEAWGVRATLEPLPSELDLAFRATTSDGRGFVLKVMRPGCDPDFVDMLCAAHAHVRAADPSLPVPEVVPTPDGAAWGRHPDPEGHERNVWLAKGLEGVVYARFRPHTLPLVANVGHCLARLDGALSRFSHPALGRRLKWDLRHADWIAEHLHAIGEPGRRAVVEAVAVRFAALKPILAAEPIAPIHNDLNDHNILVTRSGTGQPTVTGLLDFGDLTVGPAVAEIAIAGAYVVLDHVEPEQALATLVSAYHGVAPLTGPQLDLIWPLVLTRLAVSVTNSALMRNARPGDPYVTVSEAPAWRFLERARGMDERFMSARLRVACDLPPADGAGRVRAWLDSERGRFAPVMGVDLGTAPLGALSVAASSTPRDPLDFTAAEAAALGAERGADATWLGAYGEPRLTYTAPAFSKGPYRTSNRRTVHMAVDVFMPAGTPVHAPLDGVVEIVEFRDRLHDYGGMVILGHRTPAGDRFATLYGHLARDSVAAVKPGDAIARGTAFAALGQTTENGGWAPHLHFQLALITEGLGADWPGVADPDDRPLWRAICPNPAALLNLRDAQVEYQPLDAAALARQRREHFAGNLRLSYDRPCLFLRGWKHYLYDEWGRPYLDAYNNVPHVGHAHPRIRAVAADQLLRLNANTRYLHPAPGEFAEALLARMPGHLTHVFFVNSGSEGNELALRLARAHTGGVDMVVLEHGYHGNTTGAMDMSAYKFNASGGGGAPAWVHPVPVPDTYRGPHRGPDAAERLAPCVDQALARIVARGGRVAGFIAETFPSVAGQIVPPPGYLNAVYARIRSAGGVCIADEVQTGLGRLGVWYWGFEQQEAAPDIVVLGKPLGNGHPLGAVATTAAIARSFDNGVEFFSTFGGSTLSCRIGLEVLRIVDEEGLQENARQTGEYLSARLRELQGRHALVGDVRGHGLFVGVDLVTDRETRAPATRAAHYVTNRLREERILLGTEGPEANVLKIRPPLTIQRDDVDMLVAALDRALGETAFL